MQNDMRNDAQEKITVFYASLLALTEVGLGSFLHALHVPFSGQFLSLNQIAILSHCTATCTSTSAPFSISAIAALLKSLSPIGKKLTPMLALTMQGLLFTCGYLVFRKNVLARAFGALLSSFWGFIQPALLYSLIFGSNLWYALLHVNEKFLPANFFAVLLFTLVALKAMAACAIAIFAPRIPISFFQKLATQKSTPPQQTDQSKTGIKKALWLSIKDLFRPTFLLSFALVLFLFFTTQQEQDALGLTLLRPLAVGFLASLFLRLFPVGWLRRNFEKKGENSPFQRALLATLEAIQKKP